jgi:hypothetical protein
VGRALALADSNRAEFKAYWQIADELLEKATKEQISIVALEITALMLLAACGKNELDWVGEAQASPVPQYADFRSERGTYKTFADCERAILPGSRADFGKLLADQIELHAKGVDPYTDRASTRPRQPGRRCSRCSACSRSSSAP